MLHYMSLSLRIFISLNYKMCVVVCISLRFENIVMNGFELNSVITLLFHPLLLHSEFLRNF